MHTQLGLWIFLIVSWLNLTPILGNTVTISPKDPTIIEGNDLELTCVLNYTTGSLLYLSWYLNSNADMQRDPTTCGKVTTPPGYDESRYNFTCNVSTFTFKLRISNLMSNESGCWNCSVSFSDTFPTNQASTCLSVTSSTTTPATNTTTGLLWLLLFILLIILLIFLIFFCCGCLDCCKCCRIFKHYRKEKFCYVTWYFIKRGCCSFFFCKSGSKKGTCFCGHHTGTRCGGCLRCRNACTCGCRCNCKGMDTSCCEYSFCICCVTARREEEDPLTVCIDNKDQICKPAAGKVTISCSVDGYIPGSAKVEWTGPKENKLRDKAKYEITPYSEETGKSFLTILAFSSSDSGWYTCQAMDGEGFLVTDSINITAHATKRREPVKHHAALPNSVCAIIIGPSGSDNKRMANRTGPPAIHIGTQNRVESKTASKKTSDRPQPSPPVAEVTEDIPKHRPQPPPPENIYIKDPNKRGIPANFDDKQGLTTEPRRSSRLPSLTLKQPTVEEEDASEEPKKKRKKKKKKGQMNEENQKEEMVQLKSKKTLTEDQSDGD